MRTLYAVLLAGFFVASFPAYAAPWIVADVPDQTCTHCGYKLDAAAKVDVPLTVEGGIKVCVIDAAPWTVGSHTAVLTLVKNDAVWGRLEGTPAPNFTSSRPAAPGTPTGARLRP